MTENNAELEETNGENSNETATENGAEQKTSSTETAGAYSTSKFHDFAKKEFRVKVNIEPQSEEPVFVTHFLKKPDFVIEDARERGMPYTTETSGKVRGRERMSQSFDDERANCKYYDKTIVKISGYPLDKSVKRFEGAPTDEDHAAIAQEKFLELPDGEVLFDVNPNELFYFQGKVVPYKNLIPEYHKTGIVNGILVHNYDIVTPKFSLGAGREWKVIQEIGGGTPDENGIPSEPTEVIEYTLREPTEAERRKFRSKALSTNTESERGKMREIRVANLKIFAEIFDALIIKVTGRFGDAELDVQNNKDHLQAIESTFKKFVVGKLMRSLEIDLGN